MAASALVTFQFAAQQRENFVKCFGGLDAWIDTDFRASRQFAFSPRIRRENGNEFQSFLTVNAAAREKKVDISARTALPRQIWEINRARSARLRAFALNIFISPITRSANEGSVCFRLSNSTTASTGCPAKMCSGNSN